MTIQELEQQLLSLDPAEKCRLIQLLTQNLTTEPTIDSSTPPTLPMQKAESNSLVEFFRNSPLCEVADQIDLTRDQSSIPDRVIL